MGNESSLPTDPATGVPVQPPSQQQWPQAANENTSLSVASASGAVVVDDLEEQGRAPPSSVHPQQQQQPPPPVQRVGGPRPGARMIGAVLKGVRAGGGGGGQQQHQQQQSQQQQQQQPQQGSVPLDERPNPSNNYYSNHAAIEHQSSVQSSDCSVATASSSTHYYEANMGLIPGAGVGGDVVSSHDYFAQAQQQNYYAAQQQQQQHPPQNPYYAQQLQPLGYPQQQQQQHVTASHPAQHQHFHSSDVDHRDHPAVGIMFEKTPPPAPNQKKSMFAGRGAKATGAALISSMRNLTLGGALRGATAAATQKKEVNDWEQQWDADDDESDEDDRQGSGGETTKPTEGGGAIPIQNHSDANNGMPQHQQIIPPMDIGHTALPLQYLSSHTVAAGPVAGMSNGAGGGMMLRLDHAAGGASSGGGLITPAALETPSFAATVGGGGKTPFVTPDAAPRQDAAASEWEIAGIQPPTAVIAPELLTKDGEEETVKPDVTMFLPMLRVLGKGSFGKVVLVQKRLGKEPGGLFAMKILRKTHLVKRRQIERTRTERKVLSVVNHPFIMKLHYAFQTDDKLYLVLDYCPGGELFFHLSRFRRFPERVARFYAAELLLAIGHLHKRGIIYRDLKPENVLLDAEGHVKLGDFGLAKAGIKHPCEGATSMCGTPEYMAPEVLGQAGHGFCVDYWGLGMLLYEMMTGLPPWYTTDRAKLFRRLKSAPLEIPSYFSLQAANCVSALLERNPRRRLGVTGIRHSMEHEFFCNVSWKSLYARRVEAPIRPCEGWRPPDAANGSSNENNTLAAYGGGGPPISHQNNEIQGINANDLDAATANFDNTFTRMPVESEEIGHDGNNIDELEAAEQLNEETFLGFSFDSRDAAAVFNTTSVRSYDSLGFASPQQQLPPPPHHLE